MGVLLFPRGFSSELSFKMAILEAFMVVRGGFGVSEGGWVVGRVGGWSDAGPPSRGGWVVGRDGDSYQRVHVGKHTQPCQAGQGDQGVIVRTSVSITPSGDRCG